MNHLKLDSPEQYSNKLHVTNDFHLGAVRPVHPGRGHLWGDDAAGTAAG